MVRVLLFLLAVLLKQQVADLDGLYTVDDLAKLAQISRSTIYAQIAEGQLHPVPWALRKTRFTRQEILRYLGEDVGTAK